MAFNEPSIQHPINNQNTALDTSEIDYSMNHSTSNSSEFHNQVVSSQQQQQQQLHPNHSIDTFDPGFQVPSTEGLGLLPPPVAYKDFQYSFPSFTNSNSIDSLRFQPTRSTGTSDLTQSLLLPIPSDLSQTCFPNSNHTWIDPCVMRTATHLLPSPTASSTTTTTTTTTDQLAFNQLLSHPTSSASTSSTFTYYDPCHPSSHSSSSLPPISMSNYPSPHDPNERPGNEGAYYPAHPSKLITPPPLFDQSEQDLFSSFLNIFGDFNGEWDFDPQGMPEGMPVLGELKRRLEAENHESLGGGKDKIEADEMGRQVANRLKISESDSNHHISSRPPTRVSSHSPSRTRQSVAPPLVSRPSTSSQIELTSDHEESGRKKAKLKETQFMQPIVTSTRHELPISLPGAFGDGDDIEMTQLKDEALVSGPNDWELTHNPIPNRYNEPNYPQPHRLPHRLPHQLSSVPLPTTGMIPNPPNPSRSSSMMMRNHSNHAPFSQTETKTKETEDSKGLPKNTHIVSEQKRRNAIQGGFGSLVEILRLGESQSGITIGIVEKPNGTSLEKGSKVKSGRGRGRRGEIETGASKSVVLERAVEYVKWMRFGNRALLEEVERLEGLIKSNSVEN